MRDPPTGMDRVVTTGHLIGEQRSLWSISQTPRPARMAYGIELTRAILERMRALTESKGSRFVLMMEDNFSPASDTQAGRIGHEMFMEGKTAVTHDWQWIMADSEQARATVRDVAAGLPFLYVPIATENPRISPVDNHFVMPANRRFAADLAAMLAGGKFLTPVGKP